MRARLHLPRGIHYYRDALEGLVRVNADLYREDPHLPSILDANAGVRYRGYDPGEDWRNVLEVLRERYGDCEDLAAARAGELRARGDAGAFADIRRTGPEMTHAFVVRGNGQIEDPSRALGMGRERDRTGGIAMSDYDYPGYDGLGGMYRATPRRRIKRAPIQVGPRSIIPATATTVRPSASPAEPYPAPGVPAPHAAPDPFPREDPEPQFGDDDRDWGAQDSGESDDGDSDYDEAWSPSEDDFEEMGADPAPSSELSFVINRIPSGFQGVVKVPFLDGRALTVARSAPTKPAAAASALSTASSVLDNPMVKALIPPQAQAMLSVIQSPVAQKAAAVAFNAAKKLKFW